MIDVAYTLLIDNLPAAAELLAAVQQIEVEDHAEMAAMLRLRLAVAVNEQGSGWTVLDEDTFSRLTNIALRVTVGNGPPAMVVNTYVIEMSVDFSNDPGQSVLNVVAMDATALMNLQEKVRPWPNMADSDIAAAIFGEYGFSPQVESTQPSRQEADVTTIQRATDIRFLRELARRNGCECYVETDPRTGLTEGHFHPPRLGQTAQATLSVNMGEATNLDAFKARYQMLRPTAARSADVDIETLNDQQAQVETAALTELGRRSLLGGDNPRLELLAPTGLSQTGELQTFTQAEVDRSAWAIIADGELTTAAYGSVLRAKRPVLVRGAGRAFSGTYYVERVLHSFTGDGYTQRFTLRRNALGLTGAEMFAS